MPPRGRGPGLSQTDALGYIAFYGSEHKAASALGVGRSTLHDISHGRYQGGSRTIERIATNATEGIVQAARAIGQLIGNLGGSSPAGRKAAGKTLAREERRAPGTARARAETFTASVEQTAAAPDGGPSLAPEQRYDSLNRPIQETQAEAYRRLEELYRNHQLNEDQYSRFVAIQLSSGSGGTDVDIADL